MGGMCRRWACSAFRSGILKGLLSTTLCVAGAWAQSGIDGAIEGEVRDTAGKHVEAAEVTARNVATGQERTTRSNGQGTFVLGQVPSGEYDVEVAAGALRSTERVEVRLGEVTEMLADLARARPIRTLRVTPGAGPAGEGAVLTGAELEAQPVDAGHWRALAGLTPGAVAEEGSEGDPALSFRGLAPTQNSTQVEGVSGDVSYTSAPRGAGREDAPGLGGGGAAGDGSDASGGILRDTGAGGARHAGAEAIFSGESIQEFRVTGQNHTAVLGGAAGGILSSSTRSGGKSFHGSGFLRLRESSLAARNRFSISSHYRDGAVTNAVVKPHDLRQHFGGSIGGPLASDRLSFLYVFDKQRRGFPAVSSPTDPEFFRLSATQVALLGNRGVTGTQTNTALNYLDSLTGTVARRHEETIHFGKLDWQPGRQSAVSAEYNRARWNSPAGLRTDPVVARGAGSLGSTMGRADIGIVGVTTPFGGSRTNTLRLQYARTLEEEETQRPLPQEPGIGPGGLPPEVRIGPSGFTFGTPASVGRKSLPEERRLEAVDTFSIVRGRHQVQLGGDFSAIADSVRALGNEQGTFSYDSGMRNGRAGGLVDWITDFTYNVRTNPNGGCPSIRAVVHDFCFRSFTQSFGLKAVSFETNEWAGFVEDRWRVRTGFTLNAGMRYEYVLEPLPQQPNARLDAVFGARGATGRFPEDRNNFGPHVGVAFEPLGAGRGVVRAGYGVYYGRLAGATIRSALIDTALPSSTTHIRIVPGTITGCPQVANQGFGYPCAYLATPAGAVGATTSAVVFDRRFRIPMVQQGSLTVERELPGGITGSASYLLNLDRQLASSTDLNIAPSTGMRTFRLEGGNGRSGVRDGETFVVPVYAARVTPEFGIVTGIRSNVNATYNALVLQARRQGGRGLELRLNYTWSKAIDYGQNGGAVPRANTQFDPFNIRYDKGLSAFHYPHRLVVSAVITPETSAGPDWLRGLVNGWTVVPLFTERSGRPYTYDLFGGTRLRGGHESLNGSGGAVYLPTVGRNTLRLPDAMNLDMRLSRAFTLRMVGRDGVRMQVSAEAFNLTNHVNYSGVSQRAYLVETAIGGVVPLLFQDAETVAKEGSKVRAFGAPTAAGTSQVPARQVQLSLRLAF